MGGTQHGILGSTITGDPSLEAADTGQRSYTVQPRGRPIKRVHRVIRGGGRGGGDIVYRDGQQRQEANGWIQDSVRSNSGERERQQQGLLGPLGRRGGGGQAEEDGESRSNCGT